jgi:prophage regulatory protein
MLHPVVYLLIQGVATLTNGNDMQTKDQYQTTRPKRVLRMDHVIDRVQKSKAQIYREMHAGTFPKSFRLGKNSVGWLESDIEQYIDKLVKGGAQ